MKMLRKFWDLVARDLAKESGLSMDEARAQVPDAFVPGAPVPDAFVPGAPVPGGTAAVSSTADPQAASENACGSCWFSSRCSGRSCSTGRNAAAAAFSTPASIDPAPSDAVSALLGKTMNRRAALGAIGGAAAVTGAVAAAASPAHALVSPDAFELARIKWDEFFKSNYRIMTEAERKATIERLERRYELENGGRIRVSGREPLDGVLFGYAFSLSRCKGYRECVAACVKENNLDRATEMQYIRIMEVENGSFGFEHASADFARAVPAEGHFYIGTQCMQCENPPCVDVCPTGATWRERDGIVAIDYDWCIGCRYCQAACPYWARRFNWGEPQIPAADVNPNQHYLGNRIRRGGAMEKCTFCVQRSREGRLPACAEACPTGARTFGNLLDPASEIRFILETKKVFRLKEELNTDPKFWYYVD